MFILCYDPEVSDYLSNKGLTLMSQPNVVPFIYGFNHLNEDDLNEIKGRYLITHQLLF